MKSRSALLLLFSFFSVNAFAAGEYCKPQYLQMYSPATGVTHQVARLTDPVGEQIALFDLTWGGMLVSLKYNGVEYMAVPNANAGGQTILMATNYTPTQGGDGLNRGSTVTSVACAQNYLWITTGMTDYNNNAVASTGHVFRNSQWYFDHFMAPYTISTYAYFVPNPAGTPRYYLKLDHAITNLDFTESFTFTLDQVLSARTRTPYARFSSHCSPECPVATTPYAALGTYSSTTYTDGIAMATLPQAQWPGATAGITFLSEGTASHRRLHIKRSNFTIPPTTGKKYSRYVMVGTWANALSYAQKACTFTVSLPKTDLVLSPAAYNEPVPLSVQTGAGCQWEAWTDAPSMIVFSPTGTRTGSGSVNVTITQNTTGAIRSGNLFIAGREYPYFQNP